MTVIRSQADLISITAEALGHAGLCGNREFNERPRRWARRGRVLRRLPAGPLWAAGGVSREESTHIEEVEHSVCVQVRGRVAFVVGREER